MAREILDQRRVVRRDIAQPRLEDEHGIARHICGERGAIDAVGLNGVAALREVLPDEAMLLLAQLRPLRRQIGCGRHTWHVRGRIPGPDDELSFRSCMWREEIMARLVGPIVLHPADGVGARRCRQHKRLMASNLDEGNTGDVDDNDDEQQDQENPCKSLQPYT